MAKAKLQIPLDDSAIQRTAAGMIAVYGLRAAAECATQIEKMHNRNDLEGEAVWRRAQQAVIALQAPNAPVVSSAPLLVEVGP